MKPQYEVRIVQGPIDGSPNWRSVRLTVVGIVPDLWKRYNLLDKAYIEWEGDDMVVDFEAIVNQ